MSDLNLSLCSKVKCGSDYEANGSDEKEEKGDSDEEVNSEDFNDSDSDDFNPFGSGSDDDDPWAKKSKKSKKNKKNDKKSKKNGAAVKKEKVDPFQEKYAHLFANAADKKPKVEDKKPLPGLGIPNPMPPVPPKEPYKPPQANIDRACEMKAEILRKVEELGKILPANTLDQLIDELGGPENVSEMTGRKGRVVQDQVSGDVRYESRSEMDIPLETLNLTEKDRFMKGEKDVAIISEAA